MITFFPSLVASVVGSFLGLRFPLRLFGRGEELHTTLALELARLLARSGCIRFWMVSVVVDEVGRMDGWTPYAYDGRTALKTDDGTGETSNELLHIWWKWM